MTASFLLPFYAKMLKNGLNTDVSGAATIKLRKLDAKKLTRHRQSHKQSFKLSAIIDRKNHKKSYFLPDLNTISGNILIKNILIFQKATQQFIYIFCVYRCFFHTLNSAIIINQSSYPLERICLEYNRRPK